MHQLMNVMVFYVHFVSFIIKTRYVICHSVAYILSNSTAYADMHYAYLIY